MYNVFQVRPCACVWWGAAPGLGLADVLTMVLLAALLGQGFQNPAPSQPYVHGSWQLHVQDAAYNSVCPSLVRPWSNRVLQRQQPAGAAEPGAWARRR